ncbi:MAG: dethiobiotin synthase [Candidatus Binatus sp.]
MGQRKRFLITGTGAAVGKTTVGCALGFAMRARGMRVGVMKPIETGCAEIDGKLAPRDADALALAVGSNLPIESMSPCRYRSMLAPAEDEPDLAHIARCFEEISAQNDVVLVESAGTIVSPTTRDTDFADLAAMLGLEVIVVAGNRSGCADAMTLALQRCRSRGLKVAGYILCDCDRADSSATDANEESLTRLFGGYRLGRMRHREPLARTIVEKLI